MADNMAVDTALNLAAGKTVMYTGGATSFFVWLASLDPLALAGVFLAFLGFCATFYFSYQRNKREQREHELRMKQLEDKCNVKQD